MSTIFKAARQWRIDSEYGGGPVSVSTTFNVVDGELEIDVETVDYDHVFDWEDIEFETTSVRFFITTMTPTSNTPTIDDEDYSQEVSEQVNEEVNDQLEVQRAEKRRFLGSFFPSDARQWKRYFLVFYPVILGAMLFALNGFIDNFMVGKLNAVAAISAANQWTNIVNGIVIGVAAAGGVVSAQLFYSRRYQAFKQMARFSLRANDWHDFGNCDFSLNHSHELNSLFLKRPEHLASEEVQYAKNLAMAREYIQITALQWILFSISGNLGIQLREVGKGHVTVYWGVGTLSMNITLNAILIYGFDVGVKGAAWASVAARMVAIIVGFTFVVKTNSQLRFAPWTVFSFDWHTTKLFFARFALFFAYTTMVALVTFRSIFLRHGLSPGIARARDWRHGCARTEQRDYECVYDSFCWRRRDGG
ncbi:MATE family efflux transporter [Mycoplasma sp. ATU-Cv-508]|uniref:MATE family efflux transporter n=1 Tax=Mycoplasma sp. ATU-Cv-508 TaxID=2048001 RepID=UPI000FDE312E